MILACKCSVRRICWGWAYVDLPHRIWHVRSQHKGGALHSCNSQHISLLHRSICVHVGVFSQVLYIHMYICLCMCVSMYNVFLHLHVFLHIYILRYITYTHTHIYIVLVAAQGSPLPLCKASSSLGCLLRVHLRVDARPDVHTRRLKPNIGMQPLLRKTSPATFKWQHCQQ